MTGVEPHGCLGLAAAIVREFPQYSGGLDALAHRCARDGARHRHSRPLECKRRKIVDARFDQQARELAGHALAVPARLRGHQ
jgi:hypothetical protein